MTSVSVKYISEDFGRKTFVVSHAKVFDGCFADPKSILIIPDAWNPILKSGVTYLLTERIWRETGYEGSCIVVDSLPCLDDGDVVVFDRQLGRLEVVFRIRQNTNSLYVTNACNSRCQFCPQPSSDDDGMLYDTAEKIIDLVSKAGACVNVTGGEPTIWKDRFLSIMSRTAIHWPNTKIFVLTNGRNFKDLDFVKQVYEARLSKDVGFGIPLYADAAAVHDEIVGIQGAFGQTIRGLYNLANYRPEIEIRVVVSKLTYIRLPELVAFIGRNVPFVTRLAVMGIEPMGYCRSRWNDFWIDPEDCISKLEKAAETADNYGLTMLLYNFQLCCLSDSLQHLACSSISEWKRFYLDCCRGCNKKRECGGFFASQNKPEYRPRRFI